MEWPFKSLGIGESCTLDASLAKRGSAYAYVYAAHTGKRMVCRKNKDGTVTVTRLTTGRQTFDLTEEQVALLHTIFTRRKELKRFCGIGAGDYSSHSPTIGTVRFEL